MVKVRAVGKEREEMKRMAEIFRARMEGFLVNDYALRMSTGADHWNINSGESVAMEYSRYNYHSTDFHLPGPYRSSDHDPVVLGLNQSAAARLTCFVRVVVIPGATHLFEEPGTLEEAGRLAAAWFVRHLAPQPSVGSHP